MYTSLISGAIEQFINGFRRERAVRQKGEAFFKKLAGGNFSDEIKVVAFEKGKPLLVEPVKNLKKNLANP